MGLDSRSLVQATIPLHSCCRHASDMQVQSSVAPKVGMRLACACAYQVFVRRCAHIDLQVSIQFRLCIDCAVLVPKLAECAHLRVSFQDFETLAFAPPGIVPGVGPNVFDLSPSLVVFLTS